MYDIIVFMKMRISPTKKNINYWIKTLMPEHDVWFFRKKPTFDNCNILTIKEYLNKYDRMDYNNAYCHWLVKGNAKYVICDQGNWILTLTDEERLFVYQEQIDCERGLIIEDCRMNVSNIINKAILKDKIILSNAVFNKLSKKDKEIIVIQYAQEQDDWSTNDVKSSEKYLKMVANTFINHEGCNCLATVLYAITKDKNYLKKWITQQEFLNFFNGYIEISNEEFRSGDVVVFYDNDNCIQHSCFALNESLFLNKSGQSKFNPILALTFKEVCKDWNDLNYKILRKL